MLMSGSSFSCVTAPLAIFSVVMTPSGRYSPSIRIGGSGWPGFGDQAGGIRSGELQPSCRNTPRRVSVSLARCATSLDLGQHRVVDDERAARARRVDAVLAARIDDVVDGRAHDHRLGAVPDRRPVTRVPGAVDLEVSAPRPGAVAEREDDGAKFRPGAELE